MKTKLKGNVRYFQYKGDILKEMQKCEKLVMNCQCMNKSIIKPKRNMKTKGKEKLT